MTMPLSRLRFVAGALALGALALIVSIALALPASAQQPNPNVPVNPTASSVKEDQLLREMRIISGRGSIPDVKSYNIEQPAGRDWRRFHEVWLPRIGATAIVGMLVLLVLFYLYRGMVRLEAGRSGRKLVRFNVFERFVHWMTATCFIALALSGLNITFGKYLLPPLIGAETFASWSQWAKYAHNYLSFPFTLGVIAILLMWIAWNIPDKVDIEWLREGGGMIGNKHPPAWRFNAGQKIIYWIVVIGGTAIAATGYLLMFPFYATGIAGMQWAQMVHGTVAVLFVAVMIAHAYIGTIGMEGAFEGMWDGTVDINWAKQHHSLWLEEETASGHANRPPRDHMAPAE
ncbi:MAG TPA: formate dehydrogenase subunit gamma [Xanthobacteraceae bacterium]|jgi:formate dehydrogenase subunit gamma